MLLSDVICHTCLVSCACREVSELRARPCACASRARWEACTAWLLLCTLAAPGSLVQKEPLCPALQVTHTYSTSLDRPDHSLLQYGFVQDAEEPLLAAVDHLGGGEDAGDELYSAHMRPLLLW